MQTISGYERKKIAIFEYDWAMYSFIRDFVLMLAEAGYMVDIFHKAPIDGIRFVDTRQFEQHGNVNYYSFAQSNSPWRWINRKFRGLRRRMSRMYRQHPTNIIDREILARSILIFKKTKYDCVIGIEKMGLIWAGLLLPIFKCPLIYYSLELYTEDHPSIQGYSYLRPAEKNYHQLCAATVIQHWMRAEALMHFNKIRTGKFLYLPISVRGNLIEARSNLFCRKCHLRETQNVLLYYGLIESQRFSTDLVKVAGSLDKALSLVLHGYGDEKYLEYLQTIADPERVLFSLDFVEEHEIAELISSAAVGLALYSCSNSNDRYAAFSSVKVAYYLQCGVPIIAFRSESFQELMDAYPCGELIDTIEEIPQKAKLIIDNYYYYKKQAFQAFQAFYNFDRNMAKFLLEFDAFLMQFSA